MNLLFLLILCALAAVGLVQCLGWFFTGRKPPKGLRRSYHIVPLYDDPALLESQLRHSMARLSWNGDGGEVVLLVDMGLGEACRALCETLLREYPALVLCTAGQLADTVRALDRAQLENT